MAIHTRIYQWTQRHTFTIDLTGTIVLYLLCSYMISASELAQRPWLYLIMLVMVAPLALRRLKPDLAGIASIVIFVLVWLLGVPPLPALITVPLMVYSIAGYASRWLSVTTLIVGLIGSVLFATRNIFFENLLVRAPNLPDGSTLFYAVAVVTAICALSVLVAWLLGDLTRTRRLALKALQDKALRLEVERDHERQLAASDERNHIAREMHDIVAHSLSVIITQADGARYAGAQDPAVALSALATIAHTGRGSLREMRRLLGVLRRDEATSMRPLPTLNDIPALIDTVRSTGLDVDFSVTSAPRRELPPGAELSAYRAVQEALTNTIKHAGADAHAQITLIWDQRGLNIDTDDDGRGAAADPATIGAGQGLIGMRERVELYDGTVESGPKTGGGYRVHVFIPYTEL